jgi:hypothetical protein
LLYFNDCFTPIPSSLTVRDASRKYLVREVGDKISVCERQIEEGTEKNTRVTF